MRLYLFDLKRQGRREENLENFPYIQLLIEITQFENLCVYNLREQLVVWNLLIGQTPSVSLLPLLVPIYSRSEVSCAMNIPLINFRWQTGGRGFNLAHKLHSEDSAVTRYVARISCYFFYHKCSM